MITKFFFPTHHSLPVWMGFDEFHRIENVFSSPYFTILWPPAHVFVRIEKAIEYKMNLNIFGMRYDSYVRFAGKKRNTYVGRTARKI